jgi:membrane protease YdiL (CAAX protease family)
MTRRAWQFVGLTFAFSWGLTGVVYAAGVRWTPLASIPVGVAFMYMPALAAVVMQRLVVREKVSALGLAFKPNLWWLIAWVTPLAASSAALAIGLLWPGVSFTPDMSGIFERLAGSLTPAQVASARERLALLPVHPVLLVLGQALAAAPINAIAAFGEELGWRGFLQRELQALGFWRSALVIGVIWGVWHAPIILQGHNYPLHPVAGVAMMVGFTVLLAPLVAQAREKGGSVFAAALFHGSVNASAGVALLFLKGGSDLTVGLTGLAGFVALGAVNLALFLVRRPEALPGAPSQ